MATVQIVHGENSDYLPMAVCIRNTHTCRKDPPPMPSISMPLETAALRSNLDNSLYDDTNPIAYSSSLRNREEKL